MWIYIQSILVYLTLMVLMVALSKTAIKKNSYGYIIAAISLYSLVFGLRYGVGMDYFGYLDLYETYCKYGTFNHDDLEVGFKSLVVVTSLFQSSVFYFALIAFLNLYFTTVGLKNNLRVFPYLFFVFMLTGAWMPSANLARQCIAMALWVCSLNYAVERKILKHYFLVIAAISFHYSAIVLIPFYPLLAYKPNWFRNIKFELVLLGLALIVMNMNFLQDAIQNFDRIFAFFGYDIYMTSDYDELLNKEVVLGVGFFITLFIHIVNILNSEKVKEWLQSPLYNAMYNLYFVGILISYVFVSSEMLARINVYFIGCSYIITSFTLYYSVVKKRKLLQLVITSLVALVFVAIMYKASTNWNLFVFKGQQEYYYLHKEHDRR